MPYSVPQSEPSTVRAGETWTWTRSLSDYPAGEWALVYTFTSATAALSLTATADGTAHLVRETPLVTADHAPGRYQGFAQVSDGTDTFTVWTGSLQVLPDLSSADSYDGRSFARKMLDSIEAILENRGTQGDLDRVSVVLEGRSHQQNPELLLPLRDRFRVEVKREEMAQRSGPSGRILVRQ